MKFYKVVARPTL